LVSVDTFIRLLHYIKQIMAENRIEEIKILLQQNRKVYVNDLSERFGVSKVSARKYLAKLEAEGVVAKFYGGASLVESRSADDDNRGIYSDPHWLSLAHQARSQIADGDSIFIGSGRSCCVLARELTGYKNLTVVTNNITALPDLYKNAARVYQIGGEVTSTDSQTLFSSWETSHSLLGNIFVNKAFTSVLGLDLKAGLTVDSIISTYIFKQIASLAQQWYLIADSTKFDKIAIYQVAEIAQLHTVITDSIPDRYAERFRELGVKIITAVE